MIFFSIFLPEGIQSIIIKSLLHGTNMPLQIHVCCVYGYFSFSDRANNSGGDDDDQAELENFSRGREIKTLNTRVDVLVLVSSAR